MFLINYSQSVVKIVLSDFAPSIAVLLLCDDDLLESDDGCQRKMNEVTFHDCGDDDVVLDDCDWVKVIEAT